MDYDLYLEKFKRSSDRIDQNALADKNLEMAVGITLDSVVLKLFKKQWANVGEDPLNARSRIFFAVWVNDKTLKQNKIFYNIHALKLRELKGFSIISREFADAFRKEFLKRSGEWENASVDFGPLTLMEGWIALDAENMEDQIVKLADKFIEIEYLIDKTLGMFANPV